MVAYSDGARNQAIAWFNRLQDPDFEEAGWVDFTVWLEAAPDHRAAYDAVEAVWLGFEPLPQAQIIPMLRRRPAPSLLPYAAAAGLAAVAVGLGVAGYLATRPAPAQIYETAAGEVRTLNLADGSKVTLDRGSMLKVAFEAKRRRVELVWGEANFAVVHDAARPFVVAVGDRRIHDIGTEFDVLNQPQRLRVTVSHGIVDVGPASAAASSFRLAAGDQFDQHKGETAVVSRVQPGSGPGWRNGVLIYRDAPLGDVAADLGRYLATPVRLGQGMEDMSFSGVLRIADGEAMLARLEAFLPIEASRGPDGVLLSRKGPR